MKINYIVYSILLLSISFPKGYGQPSKIAQAEKSYERYAYIDAIENYEKVAARGYIDEKMYQNLGNSYYFQADLSTALKWYDQLFKTYPQQDPEYYYRYSQTLKSVGNYVKANQVLEKFNLNSKNDSRGILFIDNKDYLEKIKENSGRFEVEDAGINSEFSDYGASFFGDNIVFASERDTVAISRKIFKWTNRLFTNLYFVRTDASGVQDKPVRFNRKINSELNESTAAFTKDGKTMYFTRNNYLNGKKGTDSKKTTLLKLYKSNLNDKEQWGNVQELPFNSDEYSTAHPALSPDEKFLYFASDMPGTIGQSDLYRVRINDNGSFDVPENLGAEINTEGRETFPFLSTDNEMYFSTDGRPGLGGLDIYVAKIQGDGRFYGLQNIGSPINSNLDDFAFIINNKNGKGYFSSNRNGGKGLDDIYKFNEIKKRNLKRILSGIVTDKDTKEILPKSKISLFDENFNLLEESITDKEGFYHFRIDCGKTYYVRAEKDKYQTKENNVKIDCLLKKADNPIELEERVKRIGIGTDLAKTLSIPIIKFDLDKSNIRKDAEFELAKVLVVMLEHPEIKIDVRSHTDSRQTHQYNEKLSDRRAKSTIAWLVKNGINPSRLTGRGYGETQLVNRCSDGIPCTEKEHQDNRRSEFVIIE